MNHKAQTPGITVLHVRKNATNYSPKLEAQQSLQRVLEDCNKKGVVLPPQLFEVLLSELQSLAYRHHRKDARNQQSALVLNCIYRNQTESLTKDEAIGRLAFHLL